MIKIYNMDVLKALKQMPDESVDMQITSPPYWGLRDYGIGKDQIGLESSFEDYVKRLCDIFDEVKRVLKKDGTCWVNLGDTYGGSGNSSGHTSETKNAGKKTSEYGASKGNQKFTKDYAKCLICIPERFMIEMINRGWILRNKIIWHKPNHMPTSVKDRFANSWEYLFFFSKSKKYYFDLDAVREAYKHGKGAKFNLRVRDVKRGYAEKSGQYRASEKEVEQYHGQSMSYSPKGKNPDDVIQTPYAVAERTKEEIEYRNLPDIKEFAKYINDERKELEVTIDEVEEQFGNQAPHHWFNAESFPSVEDYKKLKAKLELDNRYDKQMMEVFVKTAEKQDNPLGKNPSDFWDITTRGYPEAHFAVFPEKLVERPIKTTRKGAIILDIFAGSGTTLKVARDLHRDSIGIEIKKEYVDLIKKRLFGGNQPLINDFEIIK